MYFKLLRLIYQGSLAGKGHAILVFTNLLANADQNGVVYMPPRLIASAVGLTTEEVRLALDDLMKPDDENASIESNGARIAQLSDAREWGWKILEFQDYVTIARNEHQRERNRARQQRFRARHAKKGAEGAPA